MDTSQGLQIGFSIAAVVTAVIGVLMQNASLHYAELGDPPDDGGIGLTAIRADSPQGIVMQFGVELREHYRRASAQSASTANFVLLTSVVAGVLAGFTANIIIAVALGVLWVVFLAFLLGYALRRIATVRRREDAMEARRVQYNTSTYNGMASTMGEQYADAAFHPIAAFERVRW